MDLLICKKNGEYLTRQDVLNTKYDVCIAKIHSYTSSMFEDEECCKGKYSITANMDNDTTLQSEKTMYGYSDDEFLYIAALYELIENIDAKYFFIFFPHVALANSMVALYNSVENDQDIVTTEAEMDLLVNYRECLSRAMKKGKNIKFFDSQTFNGYSKFFIEKN